MKTNTLSSVNASGLDPAQLHNLCANTIHFLSLDAVEKADSGHPGLPMGAASMAYVLWTRFLRHNPSHPHWLNRDRFVLSAGHGSMLFYGLLHLAGYDLPLAQIKQFRQWGSKTSGHPERGMTPGVETTTRSPWPGIRQQRGPSDRGTVSHGSLYPFLLPLDDRETVSATEKETMKKEYKIK